MGDAFPNQLHKGRLEALSDGVFAVVMTLLVLELKIDQLAPRATNSEIWSELAKLRRPLLAYAFAFAITGAFWLLQHRKFQLLAHTTVRHAWLTLAFLFWITLLPFTLSVWIRTMNQGAGLVLFFAHLTLVAATLFAGWIEARRSGLVVAESAGPSKLIGYRIGSMVVGCICATFVSIFWPPLAAPAMALPVVVGRVLSSRRAGAA